MACVPTTLPPWFRAMLQTLMGAVGSGGSSSTWAFSPACVPQEADAMMQVKANFAYAVAGPLLVTLVAILLWAVRWLAVVGRNPVAPEPGQGGSGPVAEGQEDGEEEAGGAGPRRQPLASTGMAPASIRSQSLLRRFERTASTNGAVGAEASAQRDRPLARQTVNGAVTVSPGRQLQEEFSESYRALKALKIPPPEDHTTMQAWRATPGRTAAGPVSSKPGSPAGASGQQSPSVVSAFRRLRRSMSLNGSPVAPMPAEAAGGFTTITAARMGNQAPASGIAAVSRAASPRVAPAPASARSQPRRSMSMGGLSLATDPAPPVDDGSPKDEVTPWVADPQPEAGRVPSGAKPVDSFAASSSPETSVASRPATAAWLAGVHGADARLSRSSTQNNLADDYTARPTNLKLEVLDYEPDLPKRWSTNGGKAGRPLSASRQTSPLGRPSSTAGYAMPRLADGEPGGKSAYGAAGKAPPKKHKSLKHWVAAKVGEDVALVDSMVSLKRQLWMVALVAAFVLYPGWAQAGLQVFACRTLDPGADEEYGLIHLQGAVSSYWTQNMNAVVSADNIAIGGAGYCWAPCCVRGSSGGSLSYTPCGPLSQ